MPNGRNAERIFGRNADSYCPISGGRGEGAEIKACPLQKYQVHLIVFVNVYTSGKFWGINFASITNPRT